MTELRPTTMLKVGVLALAIGAALVSLIDRSLALGVLVGGAWNAASLWCLTKMLNSWLGPSPSQRRAIGWLLVKFPLLYGGAVLALRTPAISLVGFGLGFTIVLVCALTVVALHSRRSLARSH